MSSPLRAGVIGIGYFGRFHARHYALNPDVTLAAVVDRNHDRAQAIADEYGCEAFTDPADLIGRVDLVSVAVPTANHHAMAGQLLSAGIHCLVEKPIAATLAEADELIALADARNLVLQVGHIERFSAVYRALTERVSRPLFIESVRAGPVRERANDVDVVLDLMIHDIDIVAGLAGAPIETIQAVGMPVVNATSDIANARLTFENGVVATVTANRIAEKVERVMRVYETDRYTVCDFADSRIAEFERTGDLKTDGLAAVRTGEQTIEREDSLANEIAHFVSCVRTGAQPAVGGFAGREALRIAQGVIESVSDHQRRFAAAPAVPAAGPVSAHVEV
ncbi:Gfo/Idh/MocA family protein [Amorphus orientalis]|uniref:Dehydrogenase n=1 Tax=Amorphus orientalis TaxID=649198 RepID=A0AAE3VMT4_9HYPH|nr:Gfo/Idh/MocA family oxidoreductase [Amorphus orientalis]MDQ0314808.1 putative dehydrogenase [Amorphus orientalis]